MGYAWFACVKCRLVPMFHTFSWGLPGATDSSSEISAPERYASRAFPLHLSPLIPNTCDHLIKEADSARHGIGAVPGKFSPSCPVKDGGGRMKNI